MVEENQTEMLANFRTYGCAVGTDIGVLKEKRNQQVDKEGRLLTGHETFREMSPKPFFAFL